MKIITLEGAEIHVSSYLVSVRRNEDGACWILIAGTCAGSIDKGTFMCISSMIRALEKRYPLGPEFVLPDGPRKERYKADWSNG